MVSPSVPHAQYQRRSRWRLLWNWRTLVLAALTLLILSPEAVRFLPGYHRDAVVPQTGKLLSWDLAVNDGLGFSVAVDGDHALVGAYRNEGAGEQSGAVYAYRRLPDGRWGDVRKLVAKDGTPFAWFGFAIDVQDGTAVISAPRESARAPRAGAVYVFHLQGRNTWVAGQKLLAPDGFPDDEFGFSLDLDGDHLIVGAFRHDVPWSDAGAAYVFQRTGTEDGIARWDRGRLLLAPDGFFRDRFGFDVALSGDTALVGAYWKNVRAKNDGAVYAFRRVGPNQWDHEVTLVAQDGTKQDWFGHAVALDGDRAIIGATFDVSGANDWAARYRWLRTGVFDTGGGAAYVFTRGPDGTWDQGVKIVAPDADPADAFGATVAIHGGLVLVGAFREDPELYRYSGHGFWELPDAGSVYAFTQAEDGTWQSRGKFQSRDVAAQDWFGFAMALSDRDIVVGAPFDTAGGVGAGAAYTFDRAGLGLP